MQYTAQDKNNLKRLYRDGFSEDSDAFVDYFFDNVYDSENVVARYEGDEMISCGHIVNKTMKYYSSIVTLPYLVAVSTLTPYRGQGKIKAVMHDALSVLENRHAPLVALYPFKHDYYRQYGFVTCDREKSIDKISDIVATLVKTEDVEAIHSIYEQYESAHDIAIHRTIVDTHRRLEMLNVDGGDAYIIENGGAKVGYVLSYGEKIEELVLLDNTILSIESNVDRENVMMRVVDISASLKAVPFDSEESTRRQIRVHDEFMGDRLVLLDVFDGDIYTRYLDSPIYSIPTIDISIEDLTLYVLGQINVLGLPKIDRAKIHLIDKY